MVVKIFKHLHKSSLMVKVSKYSIKSEAPIHGCTIKEAVLKSFKNFTEKNLCMSFFLNKVAGLQSETFLKKAPVHVFSCKLCIIF